LSQSRIQEIGATEYGVIETKTDANFTNQEISDFANWNFNNGGTVSGYCLGAATRGVEQLTGVDAADLGLETTSGNLNLAGKSVYDLGNSLVTTGNATNLTTSQGQETTSILNSNTAGTDNTAYLAGPAGGYHSIIITRNTGNNQFSIYDQGTGWDVKNTTQQGAQNEINSINSVHPNWGSRIWQLNKTQSVEVRYPATGN
jgi:hypothetical protein